MYAKSIVIFLVIFLLVDSNDSMYGSDPKFLNELKSMCSTLVEEVLSYLKTLAQSEVCLALINIFFNEHIYLQRVITLNILYIVVLFS